MQTNFRSVISFLSKEQGGDALRNTVTTVVPGIFLYLYTTTDLAIPVAVGAMLSSLSDLPGSQSDRRMSATWCSLTFFLSSFVVSLCMKVGWILVVFLLIAGFCFSMFIAFGNRIYTVGLLNLVLISFSLGFTYDNPLLYATLITCGVVWHFAVSMVLAWRSPYRSIRHAISDNLEYLSYLLKSNADFYNEKISVEETYKKVSNHHIKVSEQQDAIRMLLLRELSNKQQKDPNMLTLLKKAYSVIDLYELISAIEFDYQHIRNTIRSSETLLHIRHIIHIMSKEIEFLSHSRKRSVIIRDFTPLNIAIAQLKDNREFDSSENKKILEALLINIEAIFGSVKNIENIRHIPSHLSFEKIDYKPFIPEVKITLSVLWRKIHSSSPIFLFSLRVAFLFGIGGLITLFLPSFHYGYWLLLTVALVARPTYATTITRNRQRLVGTILGLLSTILILVLFYHPLMLISSVVVSLFGFFVFNRSNYLISVHFATMTIVISLFLLEGGMNELLGSRLLFTFAGVLLAIVGWFLLPIRSGQDIVRLAEDTLKENRAYFELTKEFLRLEAVDSHSLRLQRKKAHQALALFSEGLNQLRKEPKKGKDLQQSMEHFQYLTYRLNAHIIGIAVTRKTNNGYEYEKYRDSKLIYIELLLEELYQEYKLSYIKPVR